MDHGSRDHALLSPSSAYRWMTGGRHAGCAASIRLSRTAPPEVPGPHAIAGTYAHEQLQLLLEGGIRGTSAYDAELNRSLNLALDHIWSVVDSLPGCELFIERRVHIPLGAYEPCFGTIDVRIYHKLFRVLHILDYKNGFTIVEANDCEQLELYAIGSLSLPEHYGCEDVVMTIIQPRAFHPQGPIRSAFAKASDLLCKTIDYYEGAQRTADPEAPFNPSGKNCHYCPALLTCPAAQDTSLDVVPNRPSGLAFNNINEAMLPPVEVLTPDQLAKVLEAGEVLTHYVKRAWDYAELMARNGTPVPRHKLVEAPPRRRYYHSEWDTIIDVMLMADADIDTVAPRSLIPLTEAEKLVIKAYRDKAPRKKAGDTGKAPKDLASEAARDAFAYLTIKDTSGSISLVTNADARPAYQPVTRITYTPPGV